MENNKIAVGQVIVVEGKYDKIKVESLFDATVFVTDGFRIFSDRTRGALLQRLARKRGVVILTDSDRAGFLIRNYVKNLCRNCEVYHAYIPDLFGKERRKEQPSKEGKLGVEGVPAELLRQAVRDAVPEMRQKSGQPITKSDLYLLGLSGGTGSSERRAELLKSLDLPENLSTNGMLEVLNALWSREAFLELWSAEEK